jgi:methionine-S-sulfoxide reductase
MKRLALLGLTLLAAGLVTVVAADKKDGDMTETKRTAAVVAHTELAIFAGGCFWCMESPFEKLAGVLSVTSGYTGGQKLNPTYHEVSAGGTGHTEAVEIVFDPSQISYPQLLETLWMNIDPTDGNGQFVDRGNQYRSGVFYLNEEQRLLAEASKQALEDSGRFDKPIVTEIVAASTFYPAEDYHQDYYKKNPLRYKFYRYNSGRDRFLDEEWGEERHNE